LQEEANKKAICRNMTRPIVSAQEKKANATRYCTSPRPLQAARKRDFNALVQSCIKTVGGMSKPQAIYFATEVFKKNDHLYSDTTAQTAERLWAPRPSFAEEEGL
jgi:hypothetical protein